MREQNGSVPAAVLGWSRALPDLACDVVTDADFSKPYLYDQAGVLPGRLVLLRSRVLEWAHAVGLLEHDREDVVMAADEALSNAMEHAFPDGGGNVTLFAARDRLARAVHVVVSDNGTWSVPLGHSRGGGMGLVMMDRLADVFDLHHDERGTTVVLRWARRANA
ncbi:hypothetical protein ALI144C_05955 [Actinosynnema sp. ALI-1.44]|nr:hypothetical protein ALI144C_05955 [Actinosynnema sp. ALI-1.44]